MLIAGSDGAKNAKNILLGTPIPSRYIGWTCKAIGITTMGERRPTGACLPCMNATKSNKTLQGTFQVLPKAGQSILIGRSKDQNPVPELPGFSSHPVPVFLSSTRPARYKLSEPDGRDMLKLEGVNPIAVRTRYVIRPCYRGTEGNTAVPSIGLER